MDVSLVRAGRGARCPPMLHLPPPAYSNLHTQLHTAEMPLRLKLRGTGELRTYLALTA